MSWAHYLLQANIYLLVFYGFYKLLLDKETYFTLNRLYLVAAGLLSLCLPFLRWEWLSTQPVAQPMYMGVDQLNQLLVGTSVNESQSAGISLGSFLALLYVLGAVFFTLRLFAQLLQVRRILRTVTTGSAFSFFKQSAIDPQLPEFDTIQHHEDVHSRQYHSVDVIFFELLGILTWFNPVIYFYKYSLKGIHEYLADEAAAKFIGDKERYALLLVSHAFGIPVNHLTNSFFNKSLLKKRIYMLNQQKSTKTALLKYGLFLPLFSMALVLSSATLRSNEQLKEAAAAISLGKPLSLLQHLTPSNTAAGWDDFYQFEKNNLKYPSKALTSKKQGRVNIKFSIKNGEVNNLGVAGEAIGSGLEEEVMRSIVTYRKFEGIENGDYLFAVDFRIKDSAEQAKDVAALNLAGYTNLNPIVITAEASIYDFVSVEKQPEFKGGMANFYQYLKENIKYPAEAKANKVQGKVFLSFIVETDGKLNHIRVDRKLGSGTDEEALRVLEESPDWNPGILNGKPVRVKYNIPVSFKLPVAIDIKVDSAVKEPKN